MTNRMPQDGLPEWLPQAARIYLAHVDGGQSCRALARRADCHASTILRQVRRIEARRDDPLIDHALRRLERRAHQGTTAMTDIAADIDSPDLDREALRILRRLAEPDACLAVAPGMENAVVVREPKGGETLRTAVVARSVAEAMALRDWIAARGRGRVARYRLTSAGRAALKRAMAGKGEAPFAAQHRDMVERGPRTKRIRCNMAESPLVGLSRRKDRDGRPFLAAELVRAGERLREDFELAQMGPRVTQNWERFLTAGTDGGPAAARDGGGSEAARTRVNAALTDLGPGLGDVVLRACCFLEGMEAIEKRMGWAARSGKIVLRIGLERLLRHYDERHGGHPPLVG